MNLLAQSDEFSEEFRAWAADGYGSALVFSLAFLLLVAIVLRATRGKY